MKSYFFIFLLIPISIVNAQVTRTKIKTEPPYDITSVFFTTSNIGYAVTPGDYINGGLILLTNDSGESWDIIYRPEDTIWFRSIRFINEKNGYVVGSDRNNDGILMETKDGGVNWNVVFKITPDRSVVYIVEDIYKIEFVNEYIGYFLQYANTGSHSAGTYYSIWKVERTKDGLIQCDIIGQNIYDFTFADSTIGFGTKRIIPQPGAQGWGAIVKTNNGARNWSLSHFKPGNPLFYSIHVMNQDTVFYVGTNGMLFTTYNGGENWIAKSTMVSNDLYYVRIFTNGIGYITGSFGLIMKTMDYGNNWKIQNSGTNQNLRSAYFFNKDCGIVVGDNSTILKTINGGDKWYKTRLPEEITTSIEGNEITTSFVLNQNFPNPFNSTTTFAYSVSNREHLLLEIFDITGRKISTLIDRYHLPGNYAIQWCPNMLSSGVYICQLKGGNNNVIKRRVVFIK